jgi:hypothetical protein
MRQILIDRNKNFYKANLHCHSKNSDGKVTVEELKEHYKANGYSIIAFTDHEHLIDNSHLNDEDFLAITSCEIAIKEDKHRSTITMWNMKVCHLNLYAKDAHNIDTPCYNSIADHFLNDEIRDKIVHTCGEYERIYTPEGMREIIDICNQKGFLVAYNHPRWSLENACQYLEYKGLWAVEIYNNECNMSGLYEYDINVYDDLLRAGERIACTATDDNHSLKTACGGWTVINCESLDYECVIEAMENHQLYASTGPVIHELYVEGDSAALTFEGGAYATMTSDGRRAKIKRVEGEGEHTVTFNFNREREKYIRFDVVDEKGRRANTCAYFVENI